MPSLASLVPVCGKQLNITRLRPLKPSATATSCVSSQYSFNRSLAVRVVNERTVKVMGQKKWYAVADGRVPGVYKTWSECQSQVNGYKGALFKSFYNLSEAEDFASGKTRGISSVKERRPGPKSVASQGKFSRKPKLSARPSKAPGNSESSVLGGKGSINDAEAAVIYFDGGSRGNPGPSGCGAVLQSFEGAGIITEKAFLGNKTNNCAEYEGLILGLHLALKRNFKSVIIRGDSELVLKQVTGIYRVRDSVLQQLSQVVKKQILPKFDSWKAEHVRRALNTTADELANEAMDTRSPKTVPSTWDLA